LALCRVYWTRKATGRTPDRLIRRTGKESRPQSTESGPDANSDDQRLCLCSGVRRRTSRDRERYSIAIPNRAPWLDSTPRDKNKGEGNRINKGIKGSPGPRRSHLQWRGRNGHKAKQGRHIPLRSSVGPLRSWKSERKGGGVIGRNSRLNFTGPNIDAGRGDKKTPLTLKKKGGVGSGGGNFRAIFQSTRGFWAISGLNDSLVAD